MLYAPLYTEFRDCKKLKRLTSFLSPAELFSSYSKKNSQAKAFLLGIPTPNSTLANTHTHKAAVENVYSLLHVFTPPPRYIPPCRRCSRWPWRGMHMYVPLLPHSPLLPDHSQLPRQMPGRCCATKTQNRLARRRTTMNHDLRKPSSHMDPTNTLPPFKKSSDPPTLSLVPPL